MSFKFGSVATRLLALIIMFTGVAAHAGSEDEQMARGGDRGIKTKTVVLVHGYFADSSSWRKVITLLQEEGVNVVAVANPMSSLDDDVAATRRVIDLQTGPVVLVAHSWGGVVITEAGMNPKVDSLVYVAGFAPDTNQSIGDLLAPFPAPAWLPNVVEDEDSFIKLDQPGFLKYFAPDLPRVEAREMSAAQGSPSKATLGTPVKAAAWHTKPTWYILPMQDQIINPALEAQMAATMNAKLFKVHSSHVAMLSHPELVAAVILEAARRP
jgi:pimeloyl-ACP methyl ester carboxylesterase